MELDNEGSLATLLIGLEAAFIVSSCGSGRDVVLWLTLVATHITGRSNCLSKDYQKDKGEKGC
jgi:hypothetical protein